MMATAADGGTPPRAKSPATAPHPLKGRPRPPESHAPRAVPARRTPPASPPTGVPPPVSPHRCPPTGVPPPPVSPHAGDGHRPPTTRPPRSTAGSGPQATPWSVRAPDRARSRPRRHPPRRAPTTTGRPGRTHRPPTAPPVSHRPLPRAPRGTACRGQGADAGATVPFSKRVTGAWARVSSSRRPDHTRNPVPSPGRAAQGRPPASGPSRRGTRRSWTAPRHRPAPPDCAAPARPHPGGPGPAPRPVAGAGCPAGEAPLTARSPARAAGRITGGPLPPSDGHQCREGSGGRGQDGSVPPGEQGSRPRHVGLQPELLQHLVGGADRRGDHRLADGVLHLLDRRQ